MFYAAAYAYLMNDYIAYPICGTDTVILYMHPMWFRSRQVNTCAAHLMCPCLTSDQIDCQIQIYKR